MVPFSFLLLLFIYIFSLLGMSFFGNLTFVDLNGNIVLKNELNERYSSEILIPIRSSFNNIYLAMNTVFVIIMADGWNTIMYYNILPFGDKWPKYSIYFVILFIIGHYLIFNIFTAMLINHFEEECDDEFDEES